jgi:fatty-acyl-CoA synthase
VGKVFKPALRWDAAERTVTRLLADLMPPGAACSVEVGAHPVHGSLITLALSGVGDADRGALAARVDERLNPLVLRHELVWR